MSDRRRSEQRLIDEIAALENDPLGFVEFAFDWGNGELEGQTGPDEWQRDVLIAIGKGILTLDEAVRIAISAGNGPGKSAMFAWLVLWSISSKADTRGVITANTEVQLRTKTWAEIAKWYRLLICAHWFKVSATSIYSADPEHERTWRIDAVAWSERNVEAFAGLHNKGRRIVLLFDEASAIPDSIWETAEGALTDTDTQIIWAVAGNPTRNSGAFRECFGRRAHRWNKFQIDTRKSKFANKAQIAQWIADYGEDSDYVRVHVKGEFPRSGSTQFIGSDLVTEAVLRDASSTRMDGLVFGVDVARFGDDQSVIYIRKGRDGRSRPPKKFRGLDTMQLAAQVAGLAEIMRPQRIFVDGGGVGGGVVDRLHQLRVAGVVEVQFGGKPNRAMPGQDLTAYANKRAEMWGVMREWLKGGAIPDDAELRAELVSPEYFHVMRDGRDAVQLESKDDMRRRGLASTDVADALALTFALPVEMTNDPDIGAPDARVVTDYDPFAHQLLPAGRTRSLWDGVARCVRTVPLHQTDFDPYSD